MRFQELVLDQPPHNGGAQSLFYHLGGARQVRQLLDHHRPVAFLVGLIMRSRAVGTLPFKDDLRSRLTHNAVKKRRNSTLSCSQESLEICP
ncbi:hypothetical protein Nepgr_015693 [Nepenthes gracilis]|uniref:Uncharacterized protein n=1 Tax=Nepenthes gracilis TaxID=150966 RepID=A0AAD3SMI9_NEPGR|nr:hypothetical protein Nepgr_015693 [Nepenthes gracilis]